MSESIDDFREANSLRDQEKYDEAIRIYSNLLEQKSYDELELHLQLGGCYYFSNQFFESYDHFSKAVVINPDLEVASLGLYIANVKLGKTSDAIFELKRFLDKHPAIEYKYTLEELLQGLKQGHAKKYENLIVGLAKKNNVT